MPVLVWPAQIRSEASAAMEGRRVNRRIVPTLLALTVLVSACSSADTVAVGRTTTTHTTSASRAPVATTTALVTTTIAAPTFVNGSNRILVVDQGDPSHVVVLLHGHGFSPESLEPLAERLVSDGAVAILPKINTSPQDFGTQAIEAACALSFAATNYPELPLVVVGHSMGGLLASQYVASPSALSDPTQCSIPFVAAEPVGVVLLDGIVWLSGYFETTGSGDPNGPSIAIYDPASIAVANPDLRVHHFFSNDDLSEWAVGAAALFDEAMDLEGTVTHIDSSHTGMISTGFEDYAAAVRSIVDSQ